MSERYIPEHRRTQFKAKNTFKPDELRRRREEQQVEIRKAKREENLAKRRGITARDGTQTSAPGASLGASVDSDDEGGNIESQVGPERYSNILSTNHAGFRLQMMLDIASVAASLLIIWMNVVTLRCDHLQFTAYTVIC